MTDECPVCCEIYNNTPVRKKIECPCGFNCCVSCVKTYILDDINNAKCMSCKKEWNREFLINNISYTFVDKEYKKHREDILMDQQMSKMEETQVIIEQEKEIDKIRKEVSEINNMISHLTIKKYKLEEQIHNLRYYNNKNVNIKTNIKFYGHCPVNNCNGFINSSWMCGICETKVCKSCKEILTPEEIADSRIHECNIDTIKNLKLIKSDSKPCPKCKVSIQRIHGCRLMWCTQCHTSFDWKTGDIVIGHNHNPHFLEWQRKGGDMNIPIINDGREGCFDADYFYNIHMSVFEKCFKNIIEDDRKWYFKCMGMIRHIKFYEMLSLNRYINSSDSKELEMRKLYIKNIIDKNEFKRRLQALEKRKSRTRDIYMIFDMFTNTCCNYIITILFKNKRLPQYSYRTSKENIIYVSSQDLKEVYNIIQNLIEYTNDSFISLKKIYRNKTFYIDPKLFQLETI